MFEELTNSDLRAIANARATRKFFSRKVSLYIVLTGLLVVSLAFWLHAEYMAFVYLFVWAVVYVYVTDKVSVKIYRRLLEMRSTSEYIQTGDPV